MNYNLFFVVCSHLTNIQFHIFDKIYTNVQSAQKKDLKLPKKKKFGLTFTDVGFMDVGFVVFGFVDWGLVCFVAVEQCLQGLEQKVSCQGHLLFVGSPNAARTPP